MNNFVDTIKIELKRKTPEELSEKICELIADNIIKDKEIERLKEEYMILQNASDEVEEEKDREIERQKEIIRQLDIKNLELTTTLKEVREYIENTYQDYKNEDGSLPLTLHDQELLGILDKVGDEK